MILELIDEACDAGARLAPACRAIHLDPRTVQRWKARQRDGRPLKDERRGPRTRPRNALTSRERARLLATVNSPEFRDLSPCAIVPLLADRGQYAKRMRTARLAWWTRRAELTSEVLAILDAGGKTRAEAENPELLALLETSRRQLVAACEQFREELERSDEVPASEWPAISR